MDSELNETVQNTEQSSNENSGTDAADLKELQSKIKALEAENGKLKQSVTSASSDASKWKKQYQEKLTAEERTKQEQDEANAALRQRVADLEKERNIATISGALVAQDIGMDAETAAKVAEAMNAGETDKVLDGFRQFIIAHDKGLKEAAIRSNPTLQGGTTLNPTVTKEQFDAMGYEEMLALKQQNPELYNEYMKRS